MKILLNPPPPIPKRASIIQIARQAPRPIPQQPHLKVLQLFRPPAIVPPAPQRQAISPPALQHPATNLAVRQLQVRTKARRKTLLQTIRKKLYGKRSFRRDIPSLAIFLLTHRKLQATEESGVIFLRQAQR